jgi:hypothetical protein
MADAAEAAEAGRLRAFGADAPFDFTFSGSGIEAFFSLPFPPPLLLAFGFGFDFGFSALPLSNFASFWGTSSGVVILGASSSDKVSTAARAMAEVNYYGDTAPLIHQLSIRIVFFVTMI